MSNVIPPSPKSKYFKFQVEDSGETLRDIPVESINGVGLGGGDIWERIDTNPAWGTTSYSCGYCGNSKISKYGACVGCGFTLENE